ncbi:uncharacterized protein CTHT_0041030 [Thermochaetoides thermophila DSM 1495]|uniref:Uncharacterized protein n=1 Tax=Chaetomium thermophilum (strain DSM 1495 / CBS 144.50 / IMI 039719) TaxID=759272 RepID=G0SA52_CHATD|nr:hypothetical protein CTHT_0041030 [Thermochaetoides thermophila DSM 1495]EGS19624.1 hypothetical protein CTHT_0041030 [Thermochaetoides thermophila DSM 1495]
MDAAWVPVWGPWDLVAVERADWAIDGLARSEPGYDKQQHGTGSSQRDMLDASAHGGLAPRLLLQYASFFLGPVDAAVFQNASVGPRWPRAGAVDAASGPDAIPGACASPGVSWLQTPNSSVFCWGVRTSEVAADSPPLPSARWGLLAQVFAN